MRYIAYPIESEPEDMIADVIAFIQTRFPNWEPHDSNLDTALIEAFAATSSDTRDLASQVPDTVFRYFGANIIGLAPGEATYATTTTTWTARDTAGYIIPAGTAVGVVNSAGDFVTFLTLVDVAIAPGDVDTNVGEVTVVAAVPGSAGSGLGGIAAPMELVTILDWVTSVTMAGPTSGGTDAELDDVYLDRLRAYLTLLAPRPILPADFAILARQIPGVYRALAIDLYNPFHNLLNANEASAETDSSGWTNIANTTVGSTAAQAADGVKSVSMTAIAAADMAMRNAVITRVPVVPGDQMTALASLRANTTIRSCKVSIRWYTAASAFISDTNGAAANDSAGGWTNYFATGVAPATAAYATILITVLGGAIGEVHYVDKASIRRGTSTDWVAGGTGETGQPRTVSIVAVDENGSAVSGPIKTAIDAYLKARREINFLVYEIDPSYSQIDVTYQVKKRTGYDSVDLLSRINAALSAYFSPGNWGVPSSGDVTDWVNTPIVRYLEVAQVINAVDGVDYITTTAGNYDLQIAFHLAALGRADVQLAGAAPLTQPGTFVGTIT